MLRETASAGGTRVSFSELTVKFTKLIPDGLKFRRLTVSLKVSSKIPVLRSNSNWDSSGGILSGM